MGVGSVNIQSMKTPRDAEERYAPPTSRPVTGLLSPDLWQGPYRYSPDSELPDAVVNSYRDSLDPSGLQFLKYGPRNQAEELAFAQRVHPESHLTAEAASDGEQKNLQLTGQFDERRYFAGPDLRLYGRTAGDTEPLAQKLRRGMERALGGFKRPSVDELVSAAFASPPSNSDPPDTVQLVPAKYGELDPEPPPLPPAIPEVRHIADKFMMIADDVDRQGLDVGAGAMRHFIYGEGRPIEYDHQIFRGFPVVQDAEQGAQKHIVDWILATHPKKAVVSGKGYALVDRGLEDIKADLLKMKNGDTLHQGSHWDTQFPYSKLDLGMQAVGPSSLLSPDANLFGMTGDAMLRSDVGLTFQRRGDRIDFTGNVEHNFDEPFAFELDGRDAFYAPASGSAIPWEFTQEQGVALQNANIGKPFRTFSRWTTPVSGSLTADNNGELRLERIEWGEAGPRQRRQAR